ncbi:DNA repair protein RadA [Thermanaerovibrio velox DSM 12556]|uniref:DNA repair protein RadA n=1 Tax=Thermanaerovibrio velox DSM 12556 TaxID=926567 RepID=H0USD7_9BACT|nr:DNA repair protein RadA [Thermanaerovibrio velox]EHM10226.1 DNA repair protein RadA [Thermanaerovibrio velox DSM 12556]
MPSNQSKPSSSKISSRYRCSSCDFVSLTLVGRCPSCGAWGTMEKEEILPVSSAASADPTPEAVTLDQVVPEERISSGLEDLDLVLGGGWLPGGVVLLGGEPGVGKSTLLLQSCAAVAASGGRVMYVSGEETASQIAMRARRLGLDASENLKILVCQDVLKAVAAAEDFKCQFLVLDSVQALRHPEATGWPGSPNQVRAVAENVIGFAKRTMASAVMIGHITKQGAIAGPKVLEHLVDVVLLFFGERTSRNRLLRAEKNRFGSTDELGIFEMGEAGLRPVLDPSALFWGDEDGVSGVAMGVSMEGSRPILSEIQALVSQSPFPYPKRASKGVELNRLQLMLAVMDRRCGISLRTSDVYLNVAGGLTLQDPAVDLAVFMSLLSAAKDVPLDLKTCFIGEVGLAGEVRPVPRLANRIREAERFGCNRFFVSYKGAKEIASGGIIPIKNVREAADLVFR